MEDIKIIEEFYPEAIENGDINYKALCIILAREVSDLQDELNEKDYQILHIMEQLDKIKNN